MVFPLAPGVLAFQQIVAAALVRVLAMGGSDTGGLDRVALEVVQSRQAAEPFLASEIFAR